MPPFSLRSSRLEAATIRPARSGPSTMTGGPRPRGTTPRRTTRTRRPVGPRSRHTRHDAKLYSGRDTRDAWIDGRQAFIYKSLRSRAFFGRPHGCRASTPQRFRRVQLEAKAGTRPGEAVRPAWHGCARWVTAIGGHGGGPDLGARFGPPPEKFPMDAEKRTHRSPAKKKKKFSGRLLTFCIYYYIFVYTTIHGNVAAIKKGW